MDPLLGSVLDGRYRIERMIGKGGMGAVYAGVQLDLGRPVAIKTLFEAAVERDRERFGAEALAAASLTHPNIVQVTDSVAAKDGLPPFIVMELLRGTSLSKWIEQRGALSVPTTIDVLLQMLSALEAAHGARILHRDIKPANVVVLDGDDEVRPWIKLIDFGIAKIADYATSATTTGTILGTPSYIAPEIIAGARATTESDLYAVGLCAFEMLAGRKAFSSAHGVDVFVKILQDPTPDLLGQARVPRGLAEVVAKAMHRDPSQRFHSAREMAEALRGSGRERPRERERERARPRERPRGRGRGLFVGAFFLAVVLLAAAVGLVLAKRTPREVERVVVRDADVDASLPIAAAEIDASTTDDVAGSASAKPPSAARRCFCTQKVGLRSREYDMLCSPPIAYSCRCTWRGIDLMTASDPVHPVVARVMRSTDATGEACDGFHRSDWTTPSTPESGILACSADCSIARQNASTRLAVPGTPCRGWRLGVMESGVWTVAADEPTR